MYNYVKNKAIVVHIKQKLREIYQKMKNNCDDKVTELFTVMDQTQKKFLVKEIKSHWSWIANKSKSINKVDSFEVACDWFEECGVSYIDKSPFTLYDVVLQISQFKNENKDKSKFYATKEIQQTYLFPSHNDLRKKVQIYIYSNGRNDITIFEFKGKFREVYNHSEDSRSVNRSVMYACIRSLQALKEPCKVKLYVQTNIGFSYMQKPKKKWSNRDLGDQLQKAIKEGNHLIEFVDYSKEHGHELHSRALKKRLTDKLT